ncbi:MAG: hypothetical protein ACMXYC_02860 [Candidatus Woesearchaeota archaeon]
MPISIDQKDIYASIDHLTLEDFHADVRASCWIPQYWEMERIAQIARLYTADPIIDFGCGRGVLTYLLSRQNIPVIGFDSGLSHRITLDKTFGKTKVLGKRVDKHCLFLEGKPYEIEQAGFMRGTVRFASWLPAYDRDLGPRMLMGPYKHKDAHWKRNVSTERTSIDCLIHIIREPETGYPLTQEDPHLHSYQIPEGLHIIDTWDTFGFYQDTPQKDAKVVIIGKPQNIPPRVDSNTPYPWESQLP